MTRKTVAETDRIIETLNISKEFNGNTVVQDVSFYVPQGSIFGFIGPSGSGKTTTMRILTCFFPPTSGRATVAGFDVVSDPDEVRRVIGYMPEGVPLYREMKVLDALDFVAHAVDDNHLIDEIECLDRVIGVRLLRNGFGAAESSVAGDDDSGFAVFNAVAQRFSAESAENDAVNGADARAGKHRDSQFRDHRQIDLHAVAFFDFH